MKCTTCIWRYFDNMECINRRQSNDSYDRWQNLADTGSGNGDMSEAVAKKQ